MKEEKLAGLLGSLKPNEIEKLSEILATMQKIADTEREKILPNYELKRKAEAVKQEFHEAPKNILLKLFRSKTERQLQKTENDAKSLKNKISKQDKKRLKVENKIQKFKDKIEKYAAANAFLESVDGHNNFKTFMVERNDSAQNRLAKRVRELENQVAAANDKAEFFQNQIDEIGEKTKKLREKIVRINALDSLPGAAAMLFLADRLGIKEPENNVTETAEKVSEIAENPQEFFTSAEINLAVLEKADEIESMETLKINAETPQNFEIKRQETLFNEFENGEEFKLPPDFEEMSANGGFEDDLGYDFAKELTPPPENQFYAPPENPQIRFVEPLASISVTKAKFEEIQSDLKNLQNGGVKIKAADDKEISGNIKLIFPKKVAAYVENIAGISKPAVAAQ